MEYNEVQPILDSMERRLDAVETTDPDALLAQGSAAEDGKVIVIRDGGELEMANEPVIEET